MSKIVIPTINGGYDISKINSAFQKIEDALNKNVLYRKNVDGENNTLEQDIDANDHSLYNLRDGINPTDAVNLRQLQAMALELSSGNVITQQQTFTATEGQTEFAVTLFTITTGINNIRVLINGLELNSDYDYTIKTNSIVSLTKAAIASDEVKVVKNTKVSDIGDILYQLPYVISVATIADLRALAVPSTSISVYVREHTLGSGKGNGHFIWNASSTITDDNGVYISPSPAPLAGRWIRRIDTGVCPTYWGADPTGTVDSTAAFNACSSFIRTNTSTIDNALYSQVDINVSSGRYSISSWNLTELLLRKVFIDLTGVILVGNTAGVNVIDMIGSRFISIRGGEIIGSSSIIPMSGIQCGPKGTETCGNNVFDTVECRGYFSRAPFVNLGSETTSHYSCVYLQKSTVPTAYAEICDGLSTYLPTSLYATITRTSGQALSFTRNIYKATQVRNEGAGSAHYVGGVVNGWTWDSGCYHLSYNASGFVLYSTSTYRIGDIEIDGLFESSNSGIGIQYGVTFISDGTTMAIDGFKFKTGSIQAAVSVFNNASTASLRISQAEIYVQSFTIPGAVFFSGTGAISIDGTIRTVASSKLNLAYLSFFNGQVFTDTYGSILSMPPAGSLDVYSRTDSTKYHIGTDNFASAEGTWIPVVTFATPGDLSVSYTSQYGYFHKIGNLVFFNLYLTFTPTYTTASGEFRITGMPYSSSPSTLRENGFSVPLINSAFTWPTSCTTVYGRLPPSTSIIRLYGAGTGIAQTAFTTSNVPSGTAKTLSISGYFVTA